MIRGYSEQDERNVCAKFCRCRMLVNVTELGKGQRMTNIINFFALTDITVDCG